MFLPLKDYNPTTKTAYITILLIIINVLIFFYQASVPGLQKSIVKYALIPWEISHLKTIDKPVAYEFKEEDFFPVKRPIYRKTNPFLSLFYSMFMHGSFLHLFGNMLFLWIFGNNIEDFLGPKRFILFYLLSGIGASFVHILFNINSFTPVIGASGAISGIMGAYLILYPRARIKTLVFILIFITFVDIPASVFLGLWFFFQFFYAGSGGIAWLAHVGGFIIGIILINYYRKKINKNTVEFIE